jgi:hypothetical protein
MYIYSKNNVMNFGRDCNRNFENDLVIMRFFPLFLFEIHGFESRFTVNRFCLKYGMIFQMNDLPNVSDFTRFTAVGLSGIGGVDVEKSRQISPFFSLSLEGG